MSRIADMLTQRRGEIVAEWLRRLRNDPRITSADRLSQPALVDHVPLLLEGIVRLLQSGGEARAVHVADEDAKDHGIQRLQQGYRLEEVLWEFGQLRTLLTEEILKLEAAESGALPPTRMILPLSTVQFYLDGLACRSVKQYVEEQHFELKKSGESRLHLMRSVSHELRNVLNSLGLAAQSLEEGGEHDLGFLRGLLQRNIGQMKELLDDVLELSSLQSGKGTVRPSEFLPATLLAEMRATYAPAAEAKGLRLSVIADPGLKAIRGDQLKVKQIAANLISNAIKYTVAGEVIVRFGEVDERNWSIAVSDTGVGIADEEQSQIFSELYRVEKTAQLPGVGLGLSIVSQLVELCGGTVQVDSKPGSGSTFTVILPRFAPGS